MFRYCLREFIVLDSLKLTNWNGEKVVTLSVVYDSPIRMEGKLSHLA